MTAHFETERPEEVEIGSERSFGRVFAGVFSVVATYAFYRGNFWAWPFLALAASMLAVAQFKPQWLIVPNRLWFGFAILLAKVTQPIVLAIMFFGVLLPTGLFQRLRRKDALGRKFDTHARSYWVLRKPPGPAPQSLKQQF